MQNCLTSSDLEAFIQRHHLAGVIVHLPSPTLTVETAAQAVGVPVDRIIKSILFLVDGQPVLVIAGGRARVDRCRIAARYGISHKRIKLASPADVLAISGYEVGSMPPFGHRISLLTLMDRRLFEQDQDAYAGGGEENALLRIRPEEIRRVSQAEVLDVQEESKTEAGDSA